MPLKQDNTLQDIFRLVADVLTPAGIHCLLIGGFAVNHYGYTRHTLDVDLMIVAERREDVLRIMKREGFTNTAVHENVMFFQRPGTAWRIDFLCTEKETMTQLLSRAETVIVHGAAVNVPALKDLLAMKLFSLAQNFERRMGKDLPDIAYLTVSHGLDLERDIHPLATRYATEAIFTRVSDQVRALKR